MSDHPLGAAIAGVLLFAIGIAIAAGTLVVNRQEQTARAGWQRADGTVVELLKRRTIDGDLVIPLVAFTTKSGDRVSFTGHPSSHPDEYRVTASVAVLYDPARPQDAQIDPRARRWTRNALATGAAALLLALGGYVAWYASHR